MKTIKSNLIQKSLKTMHYRFQALLVLKKERDEVYEKWEGVSKFLINLDVFCPYYVLISKSVMYILNFPMIYIIKITCYSSFQFEITILSYWPYCLRGPFFCFTLGFFFEILSLARILKFFSGPLFFLFFSIFF